MSKFDFERIPDRRNTDSVKWNMIPEDVIPMWVADMDICAAPVIAEAVADRAAHLYYGYPNTEENLKELIAAHYRKVYQVDVPTEWIVLVPSVIPGLVNALQMMGGAFMYFCPMYDHIRNLYREAKLPVIEVPLRQDENFRFSMDIAGMEAALTPEVTCVVLCNPHNPVGRVYDLEELEALQEFCEKNHLFLISDEIHCELALDKGHIPYFSVNEKAADYSVTLSSAGKICNIPGLPLGFAIIPNKELRDRFAVRLDGLLPCGNVLTLAAYEKAYDGSCDEWKNALREHLRANRDYMEERIAKIPELRMTHNEGTYLSWIDCSALRLPNPAEYFLKEAKVKVSDGTIYGNTQCVRLNFGCPKAQLEEALDRLESSIRKIYDQTLGE